MIRFITNPESVLAYMQSGGEINHVAGCVAPKTVVPLIQFQAGLVVIVEGASCHPVLVHSQTEVFGSLSCGDCCLDGVVDVHVFSPFVK